jgi:geranylgeranyl diphosphate synthase type I
MQEKSYSFYAKQKIKEFREEFNPFFYNTLDKHILDLDNTIIKDAIKFTLNYSKRDAKRLRPSFVYYAHKLFKGSNKQAVYDVGAAIELFHTYLLVLDDYMDKSETRRGGLTVHEFIYKKYADKIGARHYANSVAISLAAGLNHIASEILLNAELPDKIKTLISKDISHRYFITAQGQIKDVTLGFNKKGSEEDVLDMLKQKTGVYTYENPLITGMLLAEIKDDTYFEAMSNFAIPGGIAFQIHDDIIGMFGDANITGKSDLDDLKEGKYTLLIQKTYEMGTKEHKNILNQTLGKRDLTLEEYNKTKDAIKASGALDYSKQKAKELVEEAKAHLLKLDSNAIDEEALKYIFGISDYMIERTW